MKITLSIVPPGGGEADYGLDVDLPEIPRIGDYLAIFINGESGQCDFVVRRVKWYLKKAGQKGATANLDGITVECEYALSARSSESHKRSVEANPGEKSPQQLEESGF